MYDRRTIGHDRPSVSTPGQPAIEPDPVDPVDPVINSDPMDREELEAEFLHLTGKQPDKRWKLETLQEKVDIANGIGS